jgi:hypothetical protein
MNPDDDPELNRRIVRCRMPQWAKAVAIDRRSWRDRCRKLR